MLKGPAASAASASASAGEEWPLKSEEDGKTKHPNYSPAADRPNPTAFRLKLHQQKYQIATVPRRALSQWRKGRALLQEAFA